jgi:hypothetical protein
MAKKMIRVRKLQNRKRPQLATRARRSRARRDLRARLGHALGRVRHEILRLLAAWR